MNWLLIGNGFESPQYDTCFAYYNYVQPLIKTLGHPFRLKTDTIIGFEDNEITVRTVGQYNSEEVSELLQREHFQLVIEIFKDKPSGVLHNIKSNHSSTLPPVFGICLDTKADCSPEAHDIYDEIWGFNTTFRNTIPEGLFLDNYQDYQLEKKYDLSYIGTATDEKAKILTDLVNNGFIIHVWGFGWEKYKELRYTARGYLPHWEMQKKISQSKINLHFTYPADNSNVKQHEIVASGGNPFNIPVAEYESSYSDTIYNALRKALASNDKNKQPAVQDNKDLFEDIKQKTSVYIPDSTILREEPPFHKLAIVCPVHNQEKYLEQTIISVLGQTSKDFEFLILDDGSTDKTADIIKKYSHDKRLRYKYQNNIGKNLDAFDKLIQTLQDETNSTYIARIDGDDIMYPHRIKNQLDAFEQNEHLSISYTNISGIVDSGKSAHRKINNSTLNTLPSKSISREMYDTNFILHPTIMMKRKDIEEMGGFQTPYASDLYFWMHASPYLNFAYIEEPGILYRHHNKGSSTGLADKSPAHEETLKVLVSMRGRYTILNLYEEIENAPDKDLAFYLAYIHLSTLMAFGKKRIDILIVQNCKRALEHNPFGLEALNYLLIIARMNGHPDFHHWINYVEQNKEHLTKESNYELFNDKLQALLAYQAPSGYNQDLLQFWMHPNEEKIKEFLNQPINR